ncbi:MAG: hypothetical protein ORN58_01210, partial [Sediminibacterium sp.]|nr:hypothetical protein [Sediminibacterium sp.]
SNSGGVVANGISTNKNYTPVTNTLGTNYYYLVATNTIGGCATTSVQTGAIAVINSPSVSDFTGYIVEHNATLADTFFCTNLNVTLPLQVVNISNNNTLNFEYKWFYNTTKLLTGRTLIPEATTNLFTPTKDSAYNYNFSVSIKINGLTGCNIDSVNLVSRKIIVYEAPQVMYNNNANTGDTLCFLSGSTFKTIQATPAYIAGGAKNANITTQWYSNTSPSTNGASTLNGNGANTSVYSPQSIAAGSLYYFAKITNGFSTCNYVGNVSARFLVLDTPAKPQVSTVQSFNLNINDTLKYILPNPLSTNPVYRWYNALTGGSLYTEPFENKLKNDSNYFVTLTQNMHNFVCESYPRKAIKVKIYIPPKPVNAPSIVRAGQNSVNISITPKSEINLDSATSYVIISNPAGVRDSVYTQADIAALTSNAGKIITGLLNKVTYTFTVKAINSAGDTISSSSTSVIPNNDSILNYMSTSFRTISAESGTRENQDYIQLPSMSFSGTPNYTIECWFKLEGANGSPRRLFELSNGGLNAENIAILLDGNNLGVQASFLNGGNTFYVVTLNGAILTNWNHYALTYSNNNWKLYINGVFVTQNTGANPSSTYTTNYIGVPANGDISTLGRFADFRIWKRAKTGLEIYKDFNTKNPSKLIGDSLYYWLTLANKQHERVKSYNINTNTNINTISGYGTNSTPSIIKTYNNAAQWSYDPTSNTGGRLYITVPQQIGNQTIQYSIDNGQTWLISNITNLNPNNTDYQIVLPQTFIRGTVRVRLVGTMPIMDTINLTPYTIQTVPDTVTITSVQLGYKQATINFARPLGWSNGGAPVTKYRVLNNVNNIAVDTNNVPLANSILVTGLTSNTDYRFRMILYNGVGIEEVGASDTSAYSTLVTPLDSAVINNITICDTIANVNFTTTEGGLNYVLNAIPVGGGSTQESIGTTVNGVNIVQVTNLLFGKQYIFTIQIKNSTNTLVSNYTT